MNAKTTAKSDRAAIYWLAAAATSAAVFGSVPAVWDLVEYVQFADAPGSPFVARWALALSLVSVIQLAYGVYLFLLPDWTSAWVVTLSLLALSGLYAMGLAIALTAAPTDWLVGRGGLQLTDKLPGGKAALWCLCMVSLSTILAFFAGRLSYHAKRAEMVRRRAGL